MLFIIIGSFLILLFLIVFMRIRRNKKIVNQEFVYLLNEVNKYKKNDTLKLEVAFLSNETKKEYFNIILDYFSNNKMNLSQIIIDKIEIVSCSLGYYPDEVSFLHDILNDDEGLTPEELSKQFGVGSTIRNAEDV